MLDLLLNAAALDAVVFALFVWVLLGRRGRRRMWSRVFRAASASVNGPLTRPRRPSPPRSAKPALRIRPGERDRSRDLMILSPGMEFTPMRSPSSFDPLLQLAAGRPPAAAPVTSWAPAAVAAMPSTRCDACPLFGCGACRKDTEPSRLRALLDADATREQIMREAGVDIGDGSPANPTRSCLRCRLPLRSFLDACACPQPSPRPAHWHTRTSGSDLFVPAERDCQECERRRPPEERLAASLPCPLCRAKPSGMGWREAQAHRRRCVLYKRPTLAERQADAGWPWPPDPRFTTRR